jgi:hypothetical protein
MLETELCFVAQKRVNTSILVICIRSCNHNTKGGKQINFSDFHQNVDQLTPLRNKLASLVRYEGSLILSLMIFCWSFCLLLCAKGGWKKQRRKINTQEHQLYKCNSQQPLKTLKKHSQ